MALEIVACDVKSWLKDLWSKVLAFQLKAFLWPSNLIGSKTPAKRKPRLIASPRVRDGVCKQKLAYKVVLMRSKKDMLGRKDDRIRQDETSETYKNQDYEQNKILMEPPLGHSFPCSINKN